MRVIKNYLALSIVVVWSLSCATCVNHGPDSAVFDPVANDGENVEDDSVIVDGMSFVTLQLLLRL